MLIELYGSHDSFLEEYENYLAEKILYFKNFDLEEELQKLDLLKKHLKKNSKLARCYSLIKDLNESKKITDQYY